MVYFVEKNIKCPAIGEMTERPVKYNFWGGKDGNGCYIQMENGKWIYSGNYQGINIDEQ